jgi:hypothetical protein
LTYFPLTFIQVDHAKIAQKAPIALITRVRNAISPTLIFTPVQAILRRNPAGRFDLNQNGGVYASKADSTVAGPILRSGPSKMNAR